MVFRCPTYFQAVKWARLESSHTKFPEPDTDFPDNQEIGDAPLICAQIKFDARLGRATAP
jgi:hypothetical protein